MFCGPVLSVRCTKLEVQRNLQKEFGSIKAKIFNEFLAGQQSRKPAKRTIRKCKRRKKDVEPQSKAPSPVCIPSFPGNGNAGSKVRPGPAPLHLPFWPLAPAIVLLVGGLN